MTEKYIDPETGNNITIYDFDSGDVTVSFRNESNQSHRPKDKGPAVYRVWGNNKYPPESEYWENDKWIETKSG